MGLRTILIYVGTTTVAIILGLVLVNVIKPGEGVSEETISKLTDTYASNKSVMMKLEQASKQQDSAPLKFLEDMVPDNAFAALGNNQLMLQVIFFTIFMGISMLLVGEKRAKPLKKIFDSLNDVVLKMVDLIMLTAPFAVFALLANVCLLYTSPSPRDRTRSRMPSSA